jgi:exopolysaccharide biosynthesis polyprenyl glycosylphosphotransferase
VTTTLALLEVMSVFATVRTMLGAWTRPLLADPLDMTSLSAQAVALTLCCAVAFYYNDLYDFRTVRRFQEFVSRLPRCIGILVMLSVLLYSVVLQSQISVGAFTASLLLTIGVVLLLRAVWYAVIQLPPLRERVLILGATPLAHKLIAELTTQSDCLVVGVLEDADQLGKMIGEAHPDQVIVAVAERRGRLPVQQLLEARMQGITVEDGVEVYERLTGKLAIESLTPSNLIFLEGFQKSRLAHATSRGISLLVSVVGLICFAPVFALIALAIKLDSPGPVFFVQERIGTGCRRFKLIKFRTMHPASGKTSEWVRDNGERITRVGRWLRKFRLDELPQFVNILRGDMNLVGPRPHPASNFELLVLVSRNAPEHGGAIPYYSLRSTVRPGVTGWAQVRFRYANDLEEEIEKLRYDLYYIKHQSLWLDLRILFDTVKIVLAGSRSGADEADHAIATSKGAPLTPGIALPVPRRTYPTRITPPGVCHDREHQRAS